MTIHAHNVCCPLCHAHPSDPCLSRQKNPLRYAHDERADAAAWANTQQEERANA